MVLALALVALLVAVVAVVVGARGWRRSHRLALEMVHLRDRLTRAEDGYREASANAVAAIEPGAHASRETWAPRMAELEDRLRTALERDDGEAVEGLDPEGDPRRAIRRHFALQGYERVAILDEQADGSFLLEAERAGVMAKGRAEVLADGSVRMQSISSLRAFP